MKHSRIPRFTFPLVVILTGFVCSLVMWKYGVPEKRVLKAKVAQKVVAPAVAPAPIVEAPAPVVAAVTPPPAPIIEAPAPVIAVAEVPPPNAQPQPSLKSPSSEILKRKKSRTKLVRVASQARKNKTRWSGVDSKRFNRARTIIVEEITEEAWGDAETAALDSSAPLDELASEGFLSDETDSIFHEDSRVSLVQLDESLFSKDYPSVERVLTVEGVIKQNEFGELAEELATLQTESLPEIAAPEVTVQVNQTLPLGEPKLSPAAPSIEPTLAQKEEASSPTLSPKDQEAREALEPIAEPPQNEEIQASPVEAPRESPSAAIAQSEKANEVGKSATTVSAEPQLVVTTPSVTTQSNTKKFTPAQNPSAHPKPNQQMGIQRKGRSLLSDEKTDVDPKGTDDVDHRVIDDAGKFEGKLIVDSQLRAWLKANKGHFELYLHREKSRDPQDTKFIDYEFGEPEFEFEGRGLTGRYRLVAAFYAGTGATPVAQVQYPKAITAADYKEKIVFELKKKDFDKSASTEATPVALDHTVINLTVFKAAPGNYRQSTPVAGAKVSVIGFTDWGMFTSDAEGNVRIPNVTRRSEYLLDISAQGYYSARQIVPVFDTSAYGAAYLISRDDVYSITNFFTKKEQGSGKSVVMGRVFDSKTRAPQESEEVALSYRKGRPVYFGALPDLSLRATSGTGLFGFFNVEPSVRSVMRASGKHSSLANILPDYGHYVELGRGGEKSLKARLFDPFRNMGVSSKVHLVGDESNEEITNDEGFFKIPGIDLPPGALTIEMKSEGFPITWHTVPWNTREPERAKNLFLMDKEVIEESRKINRVQAERGRGAVVGGAENSFFTKGRTCVQVELVDQTGQRVNNAFGPFPIAGAKNPSKGFCLTPEAPGFAFYNVPSGEYLLKWQDKANQTFRTRLVRVGMERLSVVVN